MAYRKEMFFLCSCPSNVSCEVKNNWIISSFISYVILRCAFLFNFISEADSYK